MRVLGCLTTAALALMFLAPAREMRADTLFSNFGPAQTYNGTGWWLVGATNAPPVGPQADAFSFVPTETTTLTGADLALSSLAASTPLTVYIESNSGGAPGTILDTLSQTGSYSAYPVTSVVSFACTGTCTTLDAGTTYWIVATANDPANTSYWMYSYNDSGTWYFNYANDPTGPWTTNTAGSTFGAFDVTGATPSVTTPPSATPEPSSLALLGSGLIGIVEAARRKTRKA